MTIEIERMEIVFSLTCALLYVRSTSLGSIEPNMPTYRSSRLTFSESPIGHLL